MPVKANTEMKKFNPSLGHAFSNNKFGDGSVLLRITAENLDTIMKNLQVGSTILFKYNKVTTKGDKHYFSEILPPLDPNYSGKAKAKTAAKQVTSELD